MILENVDQVLIAIEDILAEVKDNMFDMNGEMYHEAEQELKYYWGNIQKLYPIKDGIEFMRKNYPDQPVHLSVTEIGVLLSMRINPEIGGESQ